MSDRTVALTVVLDHDYRIDDIKPIMDAIEMIKGVTKVEANVADMGTYVAYSRARTDLEAILFNALREKTKQEK